MQLDKGKEPQTGNDVTREIFLDNTKTSDLDEKLMDIKPSKEKSEEINYRDQTDSGEAT